MIDPDQEVLAAFVLIAALRKLHRLESRVRWLDSAFLRRGLTRRCGFFGSSMLPSSSRRLFKSSSSRRTRKIARKQFYQFILL